MPAPIVLYPFKFRSERTGRWVCARYLADLNEIAARYAEWQITGAPETRSDVGGSFSPVSVGPANESKIAPTAICRFVVVTKPPAERIVVVIELSDSVGQRFPSEWNMDDMRTGISNANRKGVGPK